MNAPQAAPAALWWNDGDAFRSRLFDAISLLLPSGEQFVIATLSDWLLVPAAPAATPALCLSARRFIGEEQAHSRAHQLYNDRLAASVPAARLERRVAMAMQPMAQWRLGTRVAFCAAFEQLTALLSTEVLRPGSVWMTDNATPQARLWRWHCAEELGHRHVAPEVAAALGVSRTHCALALLAAAGYLWIDVLVALCAMLFVDVRASRIGLPRLLFQTGRFALRASPGMLRMAGSGLRLMFRGR